jgi:hypothetical protein
MDEVYDYAKHYGSKAIKTTGKVIDKFTPATMGTVAAAAGLVADVLDYGNWKVDNYRSAMELNAPSGPAAFKKDDRNVVNRAIDKILYSNPVQYHKETYVDPAVSIYKQFKKGAVTVDPNRMSIESGLPGLPAQ